MANTRLPPSPLRFGLLKRENRWALGITFTLLILTWFISPKLRLHIWQLHQEFLTYLVGDGLSMLVLYMSYYTALFVIVVILSSLLKALGFWVWQDAQFSDRPAYLSYAVVGALNALLFYTDSQGWTVAYSSGYAIATWVVGSLGFAFFWTSLCRGEPDFVRSIRQNPALHVAFVATPALILLGNTLWLSFGFEESWISTGLRWFLNIMIFVIAWCLICWRMIELEDNDEKPVVFVIMSEQPVPERRPHLGDNVLKWPPDDYDEE